MSRTPTPLPSEEQLLELAAKAGWRTGSLARELGMSSRQLERRFRREYRLTPHEWIDKHRCVIAVRELKERKQSKWIASDLGFASNAHFSRWFKAHMVVTASAFVQAIIDSSENLPL